MSKRAERTFEDYPMDRTYGYERYVKVKVKIKTWTVVEDVIDFDTHTNQFIIPNKYQIDAKVIAWEYVD